VPRKRKPPEPASLLEVVVIGSCLAMWAYLLAWGYGLHLIGLPR